MAITNEATIRVRIDGKDAEISVKDMGKAIETAMKRGKVEADKLKTSFTKIGNAAQRFYFSFQSLKIFVRGAMDFVNASNRQEEAVAGFEQAMRSMGRYTEIFSKQLQDLASQIQSEGIIGDEAILEGTKFLATYKDISDETLPRAMRVMTDIAALMGGDMRSAANMVGKASMGMVGELRRAGITISEATMKSKDFNAILREIEEQVAGQNKALAATSAGGMKQFANAWGDLKEQIGTVLKQFMIPFLDMLRPLVEMIKNADTSLLAMAGTIGLTGITLMKLIPILRSLGIVSKSALGWIGIIITVLGALYTAWTTNFLGIRDALTNFWEFMKGWATNVGSTLKALGKLIVGVLTFSGTKIKEGWQELKDSFVSHWKAAFQETKTETLKAVKEMGYTLTEPVKEVGKALGGEFGKSFAQGIKSMGVAGGPRGAAGGPSLIEEMAELAEPGKSPFWQVMDMFSQMGDITQNTFNAISSSFQSLSNQLVQAMFNTKTKFKDIWVGMAMDFTRIFVNYVLSQLAQMAAIRIFGGLFANLIMPGAGSVVSAMTFTPGFTGASANNNALLREVSGLRNDLKNLGGPIVINNKIGSTQLYEGIRTGRERDLIRRGKEINQNLF